VHLSTPNSKAPYRYLFLDLNSFFASVEQQEDPKLRYMPVGVVPMLADSTCLIAASYEAKAYGVKTLTKVADAKQLCPQIRLIEAKHGKYTEYHDRIVAAVETVLPVDKVCSIDEMRFRLLETEATEASATEIALRLKAAIREQVGECMTSSIGLASNAFLAKVASDMQKPDGLVLLHPSELTRKLSGLKVTEFCGINRRMAVRLNLAGIYTADQMLKASEQELRCAFGSVLGARWWYLLRGYDVPEEPTRRRSLGNSHVLPPEFRTREGGYEVLLRLIQKSTARLRKEGLSARSVSFMVRGEGEPWFYQERHKPTCDTIAIIDRLHAAWPSNPIKSPTQVALTFSELVPTGQMTLSMFDEDNSRLRLAGAVDKLNERFGRNTILPAGLVRARDSAEERIAFQKVSLFDEGSPKPSFQR
jgi:DNA polymerase-4